MTVRRRLLVVTLVVLCGLGSAGCGAWHPKLGSPRLHLTVAGGCPADVTGYATVANPHGGSPTRLVPPGPDAVLVCRYAPYLPPGTHRWRSRPYREVKAGASAARRIAAAADRIRSRPPPHGPIDCPADVGSATIIAFAYPGGAGAALRWQDSGCQQVDNGNLAAFQMNDGFDAFQQAVDAVAPHGREEG